MRILVNLGSLKTFTQYPRNALREHAMFSCMNCAEVVMKMYHQEYQNVLSRFGAFMSF